MEWRSIVLKNIWRNIRRYLGYLLASGLSVGVFSLFFIFLFNPYVYSLATLQMVAVVLVLCVFIIAWFAVFFIFYFHSSLIRLRNKEFGVLMTLGMTPRQIARLIFVESICIALVAIVLGLVLGILGSKPFLLAMGSVLGLQDVLPFTLSPYALLVTVLFFTPVFLIEAALTSRRIRKRTPRMLLLGSRSQQTPPKASLWKVLAGILCLAIAYDQAIQFSWWFGYNAIPIVLLTIFGTFLLFGQVMVMLLGWLRKLSLRGIPLLIVARLSYRMKDYARILAIVTVLNACVLIGMGAVYGFLQGAKTASIEQTPVNVEIAENIAQPGPLSFEAIEEQLQDHHVIPDTQKVFSAFTGTVQGTTVSVLSQHTYNEIRRLLLTLHPELGNSLPDGRSLSQREAVLNVPKKDIFDLNEGPVVSLHAHQQAILQAGSMAIDVKIVQRNEANLFNKGLEMSAITLVIDDDTYTQWTRQLPKDQQWHVLAMQFANNQQITKVNDILNNQLSQPQRFALSRAYGNVFGIQLFSTLLFAGSFISFLFLVAGGSALYFRLFTQQEEDRRQFYALARVGLSRREALVIVGIELLLVFFLPVLLAIVHSGVATLDLLLLMGPLGHSLANTVWVALASTCGIYTACFAIYYVVALFNYFRRILLAIV